MKAVIIDDEQNGREILRTLLTKYVPEVTTTAEANNAKTGLRQILQTKPDIVFLDIEMPNGSGFDLLEAPALVDREFHLVFTTAYEEYALKAFRYQALDYLLKPIDIKQLRLAVQRCQVSPLPSRDYSELAKVLRQKFQRHPKVTLATREGFEILSVSDIIYCKSEINYTRFFLIDGSKRLVSKTMKTYQSLLEGNGFYRIHKSYIVNLNEVTNFVQGKPAYLKMSNGDYLEISRNKKAELIQILTGG